MILESHKIDRLSGTVTIPASKSHTIRALVLATLARGISTIRNPLDSWDTKSCIKACEALGAKISEEEGTLRVVGMNGVPHVPEDVIDVGNSGTTIRLLAGVAALAEKEIKMTGDEQIRRRPISPLLKSLNDLGGHCVSEKGNGFPPFSIKGKITGGKTSVSGISSQFLSSLLLATPFASGDSILLPHNLQEKPYVEMTLSWMDKVGIIFEREGYERFNIKGNQRIDGFDLHVPSDFSSATFVIAAAAMIDSEVTILGLDMEDTQGDKKVIEYLKEMGTQIEINKESIVVKGGKLKGTDIDLNSTPDALPAMAVIGCLAEGKTRLLNVPQARIKETDRISVMADELGKMGAKIIEHKEGLEIEHSELVGAEVSSHGDQRISMALALAGMVASGTTTIDDAECYKVTFPTFVETFKELGAKLEIR